MGNQMFFTSVALPRNISPWEARRREGRKEWRWREGRGDRERKSRVESGKGMRERRRENREAGRCVEREDRTV